MEATIKTGATSFFWFGLLSRKLIIEMGAKTVRKIFKKKKKKKGPISTVMDKISSHVTQQIISDLCAHTLSSS